MSKINSCYPLCPLIDQKSFFGVSDDCESGYLVVTLGKNMVVRYKLSDQKQVSSWNTKIRLSSPVVYDKYNGQYVGVFNGNTIQMWSEHDTDLNKIKKYKFKNTIHCVLSNNDLKKDGPSLVVVFKNGSIAPLTPEILANRKNVGMTGDLNTINLLDNNTVIEDAHLLMFNGNLVVALVCSTFSNKTLVCHIIPLEENLFEPFCFNFKYQKKEKTHLTASDDVTLTGYAFVGGDDLKLLTVWSNSDLYCLEFHSTNLLNIGNQFPGQKIMELKIINTKLKAAVLPLDRIGCHIAMYGSDPSEEGALLTIINIKHKVVQCRYNLKLYCTSPRLWSGGPTDLLLIVGQHLAVAHYRLVSQKLAALVGSQADNTSMDKSVLKIDWHTKDKQVVETADNCKNFGGENGELDFPGGDDLFDGENEKQIVNLKEDMRLLFDEGLSEAGICDKLIPTLIETRNTLALIWLFKNLKDIPLNSVLAVINYCLQKNVIESNDGSENQDTVSTLADIKSDKNKRLLLFSTLSTSIVPDGKALSLIRSDLSLETCVTLINYLTDFLTEYPGDRQFIEWATLLLDSFYQSFILSKEENMIKMLKKLSNCVSNQMTFVSTWQDLFPLIKMIKTGKGVPKSIKNSHPSTGFYSSEELAIY